MSSTFSEILSVKVPAGSRTLLLDLKQCTDGSRFLSISELPRGGSRERSRILVDERYVDALQNALGKIAQKLQGMTPRTPTVLKRSVETIGERINAGRRRKTSGCGKPTRAAAASTSSPGTTDEHQRRF